MRKVFIDFFASYIDIKIFGTNRTAPIMAIILLNG